MLKMITMRLVSAAAVCTVLAGCASPEPVAYTGIASSSQLRPDPKDESGRIPYRYSTQVDWRSYDKAMIDPVTVYLGTDSQFGDMPAGDRAGLASDMEAQFTQKLAKRFQITNMPTPGTLRIKLTLTGAATTTPVLGPFSHFDLAGNLYNGVQAVRGGEGMISGSVLYAVEIYDAPTSRLLSAYVTKQYPGAMNIGASFGSLEAAKTGIEKGADALVAQLR